MKREEFLRWFNSDFWRAFKTKTLPIEIPRTGKEKANLLDELFADVESARYAPSIPEVELIMNKGHGVARTIPVLSIRDYCVYYFCIKELEEVLCVNRTPNTFGGWTLGGRLRKMESDQIESDLSEYGRYSFNPQAWTKAFGEFNSLLFSQLESGQYAYVLQLDLANFYDCVRLDILERWIREEAQADKGWVITLLFYLLNHWNRRNTGLHPQAVGLPQDALADCSRILANFYLQKFDQFASKICNQVAGEYFRYADDQMILLADTAKVESLLLLLTRRLDQFGLRVNQKKVEIWGAQELAEHRCRHIQAIFSSQDGGSQNPILVKRFVKAYFSLSVEKLEASWNGGLPLLNRLLFADLESLSSKLFGKLMSRFFSKEFLQQATAKKLLRVSELNDLCAKPIDFPKRLESLAENSVHNLFHYEVRAFARNSNDDVLEKLITRRIKQLDQLMRSGAIE